MARNRPLILAGVWRAFFTEQVFNRVDKNHEVVSPVNSKYRFPKNAIRIF